jgi:hypothetical protein
MKPSSLRALSIATVLACAALPAAAQVSIGSLTNYTQDFNALPSTSANTNGSTKWANNTTLPGWYARAQASGDYSTVRVSAGENKNNGLYSFGSADTNVTDRALGSIASKSPAVIAYGLRLKNDGTNALGNFTLAYTGEQWRISTPNAGEQKLTVAYRTSAAPLTNPEPGVDSGWTTVPELDFLRLNYKGGAAALDGNKSDNRTNFTAVALTGLIVKPGEELFLRWQDVDDADQNDHGLAIDDVKVNFAPVTIAPEKDSAKDSPKP